MMPDSVKRTNTNRPPDSILPSKADSAKLHHRHHHSLVCIFWQKNYRQNLFNFFQHRTNSVTNSHARWTLAVILKVNRRYLKDYVVSLAATTASTCHFSGSYIIILLSHLTLRKHHNCYRVDDLFRRYLSDKSTYKLISPKTG